VTSTPAGYVTPGYFNSVAGTGGNYSFPASLSVATSTAPSGGVLYVNGNVGIGTASPSYNLDVNGSIGIPATTGSATNGLVVTSSGTKLLNYQGFETAGISYAFFGTNRTYGVGGWSSTGWYGTRKGGSMQIENDELAYYQFAASSLTPVEVFSINSGGNTGIGEAAPGSKLSVSGNATIGSSYDTTAAPSNGLLVQGSVGIGTTTASGALNISGNTNIGGGGTLSLSGGASSGQGNIQLGAAANGGYDTNMLYLSGTDMTMGFLAGSSPAFLSTNGPYFGARGNSYTALSSQQGNLFFSSGWTGGMDSSEGEIRFITNAAGAGESVKFVIKNTGKVGIATTTPGSQLTVAGEIYSSTGGFKFPDGTTQTTAASGGTNYWTLSGSSLYPTSTAYNVGVGNTSPDVKLEVGDSSGQNTVKVTGNVTADMAPVYSLFRTGSIQWSMSATPSFMISANPTNYTDSYLSSSSKLTITSAGNVGIGENSPGSKLSVSGSATVGASYDTTAAPTNGLLVEGNTGIGTSTPAKRLHVAGGDIQISDTIPTITLSSAGGTNNYYIGANISDAVDGGLILGEGTAVTGGTVRISIAGAGNVGIGTSTASSLLTVNGNAAIGTSYVGTAAPTNGLLVQGKVGIGNSAPNASLQVGSAFSSDVTADTTGIILNTDGGTQTAGSMVITEYNQNAGAQVILRAAPGEPGVAGLSSGMRIGSIGARGFDGSAFSSGSVGLAGFYAGENFTASAQGTYFTIETTPIGGTSASRAERLRVTPAGYVGVGTTTPVNMFTVNGTATFTGHITAKSGTAPSVSSCGTGASIASGSTDTFGKVYFGSGSGGLCTVTFSSAYTNIPSCIITGASGVTFTTTTKSLLTIQTGTETFFNYACFGLNE
jgi:hypothetical protein